jgi:hypothetical protein
MAAAAVGQECEKIGLCTRWNEKTRGLAEHFGGSVLQLVHRWILSIDVIAHAGGGHCRPHVGRRLRHGIAAKIDHVAPGTKKAGDRPLTVITVPGSIGCCQ